MCFANSPLIHLPDTWVAPLACEANVCRIKVKKIKVSHSLVTVGVMNEVLEPHRIFD